MSPACYGKDQRHHRLMALRENGAGKEMSGLGNKFPEVRPDCREGRRFYATPTNASLQALLCECESRGTEEGREQSEREFFVWRRA